MTARNTHPPKRKIAKRTGTLDAATGAPAEPRSKAQRRVRASVPAMVWPEDV